MPARDVVSWNTMITGFVGYGLFPSGFYFFCQMMWAGIRPTQASFVSFVVASAKLGDSKYLRSLCWECVVEGFSVDSEGVEEFQKLWEEMCNFVDASVEILLRGYTQHGLFNDASKSSDLNNFAIQLHGYVIKVGSETDISVVNSLITMYSRFDSLDDAQNLLNSLAIIENAKRVHVQILKLREHVDQGTDTIILTMYCKSMGLEDAKNEMKESGIEPNEYSYSALLDRCSSAVMEDDFAMFEDTSSPDNISWNAMVS
ncbi:pentatricopeptide repeat-containing protein At1g74600, chloroplastic-like [Typha angustifolia]|uniref:pentatricopeptide repeat-containing protein At1g74600, chloroplastic-like n=1 Tax=Typha angustifolia TaxID=59011 RepID=UPI003C2D81B8